MTKEYLKKNGIFIDEVDHYDGGIYLYTGYFYLIGNSLYCSTEHSNKMRYTGKNSTYIVSDDIRNDLEKYVDDYFTGYPYYISDEGLDKLKEEVLKQYGKHKRAA